MKKSTINARAFGDYVPGIIKIGARHWQVSTRYQQRTINGYDAAINWMKVRGYDVSGNKVRKTSI